MLRTLALFTALMLSASLAAPVAAQDAGGDKVNTLIVFGEDSCPQSSAEEITVCARMAENERFRIPQNLRESTDPANEAWASRVESFETVGDFGALSCSAVGLGGELGCTAAMIKQAYAEKAAGSDVRFGQLIEAARAERLSTIDAEAADTQARVEVLERQYMDKVAREQAGDVTTDPLPTPSK